MPLEPEIKAAWDEIRRIALTGTAESVLHLKCATCGSPLHIVFAPGKRTALGVRCVRCHAATHLDGEFGAPPWVALLGVQFTTTVV